MAKVTVRSDSKPIKDKTYTASQLHGYGEVYVVVDVGGILGWNSDDLVILVNDYIHNFRDASWLGKDTQYKTTFRKLRPGENRSVNFEGI